MTVLLPQSAPLRTHADASDPAVQAALERLLSLNILDDETVLEAVRNLPLGLVVEMVKELAATPGAERPRHLRAIDGLGATEHAMLSVLSDRELEVVRLVAEGLSNKEISGRLTLSDKTVKNHISHILAKLNLSARTQVAVHAIRAGIV